MDVMAILYVARVCTCCVSVAVNGDASGCDIPDDPIGHPRGLMGAITDGHAVFGLPPREHVAGCNVYRGGEEWDCTYGCETEDFSTARCDGCGSELAGTRHAMTVLAR